MAIRLNEKDFDCIEALQSRIAQGADVNLEVEVGRFASDNEKGYFPLDYAIKKGDLPGCRMLLQAGADPNKVAQFDGYHGYEPLWYVIAVKHESRATKEQMKEWIDLLLHYGANIDGADPDKSSSPLFIAAVNNNMPAFEILIDAGADIKAAKRAGGMSYGAMPLLNGCGTGYINEEFSLAILKAGLDDAFLADRLTGLTPFQACVKRGCEALVSYYLVERGEDPSQVTAKGRTLMQIAKNESIKTLIRSHKTGFAIQNTLASNKVDGTISEEGHTVVARHKSKGLSPL